MRTRGSIWMKLHTESGIISVFDSFYCSVIYFYMSYDEFFWINRGFIDCIAMILRSKINSSGRYFVPGDLILDVRISFYRYLHRWLKQITGDRDKYQKSVLFLGFFDHFDCFWHIFWITRSIRQHDSVW